jgi:hypothetical protein
MSRTDAAIAILHATSDGHDLAPGDLYLVQEAVNDGLNSAGLDAFDALAKTVTAGTYVRPWFHGVEHLIKKHSGYVYWRGVCVEHYSFRNMEDERAAAEALGAACRAVEAKGATVTGFGCLMFDDAPTTASGVSA